MSDQKISTLIALSLIASPIAMFAATPPSYTTDRSVEATSLRASARRMKHQLDQMPVLKPIGTYVGELQEQWQFPSDHLPIAMTMDDIHFAAWNVLDADYMDWVLEKNSQGLSRSMLADEHVYIGDSKLTIRDQHVADLIVEMITHPTHPRSLLSLQECREPFLEELRSKLPANFEILSNHGEAVVIDRSRFEVLALKEVSGIFKDEPQRTVQELTLRRLDTGIQMRIVNAHLPGNPEKPARYEFAQYLANTFDPNITTVAMGDMNFNELEMADAMNQGFQNNSPFSMYSPYCTNISPYVFNSKSIDHFFVYSPDSSPVTLSTPDQVMSNLAEIVALLQND